MERKFKHKITNKVIKIGGKTGLSCQTLIGNSDLILGDIIKGEDWEEVVEKDYKILSVLLQRPDKHQIQNVSEYSDNGYVESLVNCAGNKIHSIKRLSDGEIFTIGDKITSSSFTKLSNIDEIKEFYIPNEKFCKMWSNQFTINDLIIVTNISWQVNLHHAIKVKQPLFTTEDGVDIFEGDDVYTVDLYFLQYIKEVNESQDYKTWRLTFKNKEKAEEYILMNKPCLSFMEIMSEISLTATGKKTLKSLIEKKLNK